MNDDLATIEQIASVQQICKAALAWKSQVDFYLQLTRELETANASLQRTVIDAERTITRLQRELADSKRENARLRADAKRSRSGHRRVQRRRGTAA